MHDSVSSTHTPFGTTLATRLNQEALQVDTNVRNTTMHQAPDLHNFAHLHNTVGDEILRMTLLRLPLLKYAGVINADARGFHRL